MKIFGVRNDEVRGQLLHCNCSRFAMQLRLRCTPKVVLLKCNEALNEEKHEDGALKTTKNAN